MPEGGRSHFNPSFNHPLAHKNLKPMAKQSSDSSSLKGLAGSTTPVGGVTWQPAPSPIRAFTAMADIPPISVHGRVKLSTRAPQNKASNPMPALPVSDQAITVTTPNQLPTPIKPKVLSKYLEGYDDSQRQEIIEGFTRGFHLGFSGTLQNVMSNNLKSAADLPEVISQKLAVEVTEGRISGPFEFPPFPKFRCNPLGLVEKKGSSGFRLIHHLSFPPGNSVNDFIPKDLSSVQYASIQDAIKSIMAIKGHVFLAKSDIAQAFRNIPLHPDEYPLLGMQ